MGILEQPINRSTPFASTNRRTESLILNMELFAIVCLALIAAANAAPQGGSFTTLLMTDIAGARASAAEIALAGAGLDQLETQLQAFSADAPKITLAETTVETVATPYVSE